MKYSFQNYIEKKSLLEWMSLNGYNSSKYNIDEILSEGLWDSAKKFGKNAALTGALASGLYGTMNHQNNFNRPQINSVSPQEAKAKIDAWGGTENQLSPEEWKTYATHYPSEGKLGFIPNPNKPGGWIPANGADGVRDCTRTTPR